MRPNTMMQLAVYGIQLCFTKVVSEITFKTTESSRNVDLQTSLKEKGLFMAPQNFITFDVKGCRDAYLTLITDSGQNATSTRLLLLFGAMFNKVLTIQLEPGEKTNYKVTSLHCDKWVSYWISWYENGVTFGVGKTKDVSVVLEHTWTQPRLPEVKDILVSSGYGGGIPVDWTFYSDDGRSAGFTTINKIFLSEHGIQVNSTDLISFRVRVCCDSTIELLTIGDKYRAESVAIYVQLFSCHQPGFIKINRLNRKEFQSYEGAKIGCQMFNLFWLSWSDYKVEVGRGLVTGCDVIVSSSFEIGEPLHITDVTFLNNNNGDVDWIIMDSEKESQCTTSTSAVEYSKTKMESYEDITTTSNDVVTLVGSNAPVTSNEMFSITDSNLKTDVPITTPGILAFTTTLTVGVVISVMTAVKLLSMTMRRRKQTMHLGAKRTKNRDIKEDKNNKPNAKDVTDESLEDIYLNEHISSDSFEVDSRSKFGNTNRPYQSSSSDDIGVGSKPKYGNTNRPYQIYSSDDIGVGKRPKYGNTNRPDQIYLSDYIGVGKRSKCGNTKRPYEISSYIESSL